MCLFNVTLIELNSEKFFKKIKINYNDKSNTRIFDYPLKMAIINQNTN
jgi:hypothetical protein